MFGFRILCCWSPDVHDDLVDPYLPRKISDSEHPGSLSITLSELSLDRESNRERFISLLDRVERT